MKGNAARQFFLELDNSEERIVRCKPFLKWVGGKTQLLPEIMKRIPKTFKNYFEPFVGGGALFFSLQPKSAQLSDMNTELINTYVAVQNNVESLIKDLKKHVYREDYFYKIRNADRKPSFNKWSSVQRASRTIFLNKTCYNGLYRVNSKGEFNTPLGKYVNPTIVDADNLRACSDALENVTIYSADFREVGNRAKRGDFVYFDPPYVPLSATSYFTSYNKEGFDHTMQEALYALCCKLDLKGVKFMVSNSSAPYILKRYKKYKVERIRATRMINSKGSGRGKIDEVLITNF